MKSMFSKMRGYMETTYSNIETNKTFGKEDFRSGVSARRAEHHAPPVTISGATRLANGALQLKFTGIAGYTYLIEGAASLNPPITWTTLGTNLADINGWFNFLDLRQMKMPAARVAVGTPGGASRQARVMWRRGRSQCGPTFGEPLGGDCPVFGQSLVFI